MMRSILVRIPVILLICLLVTAAQWMQAHYAAMLTADTAAGKGTQEPTVTFQDPSTPAEQAPPVEYRRILEPGLRFQGDTVLTHEGGNIFLLNMADGTVERLYTVEEPWYLIDYDLAPNGLAAVICEAGKSSKEEGDPSKANRLILISPETPDEPRIIEYQSAFASNRYEPRHVLISPDGRYLLIEEEGSDTGRLIVYPVESSAADSHIPGEVTGDAIRQPRVIGFDQASSAFYFCCEGEETTLYRYDLTKQQWQKREFAHAALCSVFSAEGELFSVLKAEGNQGELQIVRLAE